MKRRIYNVTYLSNVIPKITNNVKNNKKLVEVSFSHDYFRSKDYSEVITECKLVRLIFVFTHNQLKLINHKKYVRKSTEKSNKNLSR